MSIKNKKIIVIVGGGFGGVRAGLILSKKLPIDNYRIILIDRNHGQTFLPLLYEIGALYGMEHDHPFHQRIRSLLFLSYSSIFHRKNIEIIQAEVGSFMLDQNRLQMESGEYLDFNYCILALGSVVNDFNIEGVTEYAFPFKTVDNAIAVNDNIEKLVNEHKAKFHSGQKLSDYQSHEPIRISVIGAGPNGIELSGELATSLNHMWHQHKFNLHKCVKLRIFEAGKIFAQASDHERSLILKRLNHLNVEVIEGHAIKQVNSDSLVIEGGIEYKSDMTIWTAGVQAPRIIQKTHGMPLTNKNRIKTNDDMSLVGKDNIFAVGDVVDLMTADGKPVPMVAYEAVNQAKIAVNAILYKENYVKVKTYYATAMSIFIMPIGGRYAIANIGGFIFSGFLAFILREMIHLLYFLNIFPLFTAIKTHFRLLKIFTKND